MTAVALSPLLSAPPPLDHLLHRQLKVSGEGVLERVAGGQSNPTFFLTYGDRRLVLRARPKGDLAPSAHAIDREFRMLSALVGRPVPAPRPLLYCDDPEVFGAAFYVMERVDGRVFADASMPDCQPEFRKGAYAAMADVLAQLHRQDWRELGLADFGRPERYFPRQVTRWRDRWSTTAFRRLPELDDLAVWLEANLPPESAAASIVHGDYRAGNLMFTPQGGVAALLDWELSTIGHPLADLAHSCLWWRITPEEYGGLRGLDLPALGIPEEQQYLDRYYAGAALAEPVRPFHFAFAFFRLAVIFEGIARRARQGNAASADAARVGDLSVCFARRGLEATHPRDRS